MEHEDLIRENLMLKDQLGQLGKTLENVLASGRAVDEHMARDRSSWQQREKELLETMVGLRVRGSLLKQRVRRMGETMKTCRRELNSVLEGQLYPDQNLVQLIGRIDEILEAHQ